MALSALSYKTTPSDNYAQVTRQLWDDYKTNFAPYQYELLDNLTTENPGVVSDAVAANTAQVGTAFEAAKGNRDLTMARYGMAPDTSAQKSMDRQLQLSGMAAKVGAANYTRDRLKERDMELMTSGVPNVAGRSYGLVSE